MCTAETLSWQLASTPASQRLCRLVTEEDDGTLSGYADVGLVAGSPERGQGYLNAAVAPERRSAGAGNALVAAGEAHLARVGATHAHAWVADNAEAAGFAEARGYVRSRRARFLGLDLAATPLPALPDPLPEGLELRPAADLGEELRPLYEADIECSADEPGDVPAVGAPYEEWLRLNWGRPDWDARLSTVALVGGEVAAYSVAQTDGVDRYWSGMTGTRRAFRGRGLARLAKTDTLLRARAAGYAHAFTGNDETNAPMLAINQHLGYTETGSQWRHIKVL